MSWNREELESILEAILNDSTADERAVAVAAGALLLAKAVDDVETCVATYDKTYWYTYAW